MTQKKSVKVLDCTFRDGGYYNNWDFSPEVVSFYLQAMEEARVDAVEVGFRTLPKRNQFLGAFAYSTDEYLKSLPLPKNALIGVMINAKEYLEYAGGVAAALKLTFNPRSESPVGLVRIAAHFEEVPHCESLVRMLKDLGYEVGFNIMQVGGKPLEELSNLAGKVASWNTVSALYFADSLGNMDPTDVRKAIEAFMVKWNGEIGVHAHNNMGQALMNTLVAMDEGATWLDATVLGMGRGAGNTCLEYLLLELKNRQFEKYNPEAVFALVLEAFTDLQQQYGWGPSLLYYLSASYGVHPTYIQEMLKNKHYKAHQLLSGLDFLKQSGVCAFYSHDSLERAFNSNHVSHRGTWSATGWAQDREVLVIGSGPSVQKYRDAILQFIDRKNPIVISLNVSSEIPSEKVTAYAACHKTRLLLDSGKYRSLKKPVFVPLAVVPEVIRSQFDGVEVWDYGVDIKQKTFETDEKSCTLPYWLVIGYVLALASAGKARKVYLAGFDGYGASDPRQEEMNQLLNCYKASANPVPMLAITPTTYSVEKTSLFAPDL